MTSVRIAAAGFWVAISSAAALAQQTSTATEQPPNAPALSIIEHADARGGIAPWRRIQERSVSGGREVVVDTLEQPNPDGRLEPSQQIVTETVRRGPTSTSSRRDLYRFDSQRDRRLMETMESEQEGQENASRTVRNVWTSDVNDHLYLTRRQIDVTAAAGPDGLRSESTLIVPGINEPFEARDRFEYAERRIDSSVLRHEEVHQIRGSNGEWLPLDARRGEIRDLGTAGRREEETIERIGVDGKLIPFEKSIIRRFEANGREQVVTETHLADAEGVVRTDTTRNLIQRIRNTTTTTTDGGHQTVEEIEARSPVAPGDPLRLVRRSVETVRRIGPDRWAVERQLFELDVNGRLAPTQIESQQLTGL